MDARKSLDDGKILILPYTRYTGNKDRYKPWEYTYDPLTDLYICPQGEMFRHTTTDREGKGYTEALLKDAEIVQTKENAEQMKMGIRFSQPIFGRNTQILWSNCARQNVQKICMHEEKKP